MSPANPLPEKGAQRRELPPDAPCACGDVLDEHCGGRECTVEGCGCWHFEFCPDEADDNAS